MSCVMGNRLLLNIRSGFKSALQHRSGAGNLSQSGGGGMGPFGSHATQASNFGQSASVFSYDEGGDYYLEEGRQRKEAHPEVLRMKALRNLRVERVAI